MRLDVFSLKLINPEDDAFDLLREIETAFSIGRLIYNFKIDLFLSSSRFLSTTSIRRLVALNHPDDLAQLVAASPVSSVSVEAMINWQQIGHIANRPGRGRRISVQDHKAL